MAVSSRVSWLEFTKHHAAGHIWAFNCPVRNPSPKSRSVLGIYEAAFPLSQDTLAEQLLEQTAEEEEVPSCAINTTEKANQIGHIIPKDPNLWEHLWEHYGANQTAIRIP
jgi:hypothetical protein